MAILKPKTIHSNTWYTSDQNQWMTILRLEQCMAMHSTPYTRTMHRTMHVNVWQTLHQIQFMANNRPAPTHTSQCAYQPQILVIAHAWKMWHGCSFESMTLQTCLLKVCKKIRLALLFLESHHNGTQGILVPHVPLCAGAVQKLSVLSTNRLKRSLWYIQ